MKTDCFSILQVIINAIESTKVGEMVSKFIGESMQTLGDPTNKPVVDGDSIQFGKEYWADEFNLYYDKKTDTYKSNFFYIQKIQNLIHSFRRAYIPLLDEPGLLAAIIEDPNSDSGFSLRLEKPTTAKSQNWYIKGVPKNHTVGSNMPFMS